MLLVKSNRPGKRRKHSFVPDWIARSGYGRLEGRALAAPFIFRRDPFDPLSATDQVTADVNGGLIVVGITSATDSGSEGDGIVTVASLATISVIDAPSPIGVGVAQITSSIQRTATSTGFSFFNPNPSVVTASRNYVLADATPTGTPAAFIRQTLTYSSTTTGAWIPPDGAVNVTAPGFQVVVNQSGVISITGQPVIGPAPIGGSLSGTIVNGTSVITYTTSRTAFASASVTVSQTSAVGALPTYGVTGGGGGSASTTAGVAFPVRFANGFNGVLTGAATFVSTADYDLEISDTPFA